MGASISNHLLALGEYLLGSSVDEKESYENYAEQMQLQEALMASLIPSTTMPNDPEGTRISSLKGKQKQTREFSQSICLICMDAIPTGEMFRSNKCSHLFCHDCIAKYVATKIKENKWMIKCPGVKCKHVLEPQVCRSIVPEQVLERWEKTLCESVILDSQKVYCPFKDCSIMLIDDGGEPVTLSECPNCHRLFCAQCRVPWHAGIDCKEFQSLPRNQRVGEDIKVMALVKKKNWRKCPNCNFYVEKVDGCLHISCRCGFEFCYGCGSTWSQTHICPEI